MRPTASRAECSTGNAQWRVWEYRDNQDFVKETSGRRSRNWSRGQEFHLEGNDEERRFGRRIFFRLGRGEAAGPHRRQRERKALAQPKGGQGKGKGGRKGKGGQLLKRQEENLLALQDGSVTEEKEKETGVEAYPGRECPRNRVAVLVGPWKHSSHDHVLVGPP